MNFTREPIIETIVSPKDGYKLCIRNSKVSGSEEFFVDAVEVVSFGPTFFFRGQERPKPFLVPVSDYEIFEVKETRVVLKNVTHDRNIKIGGGREASLKSSKENAVEKKEEAKDAEVAVAGDVAEPKTDKKRDRRRSRRRRAVEEKKADVEKDKSQEPQEVQESPKAEEPSESPAEAFVKGDDANLEVPSFSQMLPPPSVLISERLNQLKAQEIAEGIVSEGTLDEEGKELLVSESPSDESVKNLPEEASEVEETASTEEVSAKEHAKINTQEDENFNF